jgi:hypothetical protein
MKKYCYTLLAGSILFCGCSKEKETPVLEGEYQTGTTIESAPIQLFTKDGLVDNQAIVDRFLTRRPWSTSYFSRVNVAVPNGSSLMLTIQSNKKALLVSKYGTSTDTLKAVFTSQTDQYLVLSHVDSIRTPILNRIPYPSRCQQLADKIKTEYPGKHDYPIALVSGTQEYFSKVRPIEVIAIKKDKLFLPQFSWSVESSGAYGSKCGISSSRERNVFNKAVINQLVIGDTIVVQERMVELVKK